MADRITPACAGKTPCPGERHRRGQDHPRVCGENMQDLKIFESAEGSPPRVRGKPQGGAAGRDARGITPACAGKTARPAPRP